MCLAISLTLAVLKPKPPVFIDLIGPWKNYSEKAHG